MEYKDIAGFEDWHYFLLDFLDRSLMIWLN